VAVKDNVIMQELNKIESSILGFSKFQFKVFGDERGFFSQWFQENTNHAELKGFKVRQANLSKSTKGTIRGIHYSDNSHPQKKIITCVEGSIIDYGVDLRKGSLTRGRYDKFILSEGDGNSIFIDHGIGHAFEVTSESATIVYLLSEIWRPDLEYAIYPLDKDLDIAWESQIPILSDKDRQAEKFNTL